MSFATSLQTQEERKKADLDSIKACFPPDFDFQKHIYKPSDRFAATLGKPLQVTSGSVPLSASWSSSTRLCKGRLGETYITYIHKIWEIQKDWKALYNELFLYASSDHLRPLQGVYIPRLIRVLYKAQRNEFSGLMEPPHHVGWQTAGPNISQPLKAAIVEAYRKIHNQGVLQNSVDFRYMLIGDDKNINILNFGMAKCTWKGKACRLALCTQADLHLEMRKVKFLLNFDGARERERDWTRKLIGMQPSRATSSAAVAPGRTQSWSDILPAHEIVSVRSRLIPVTPSDPTSEVHPVSIDVLDEWESCLDEEACEKRFEVPVEYRSEPFDCGPSPSSTSAMPSIASPTNLVSDDPTVAVIPTTSQTATTTTAQPDDSASSEPGFLDRLLSFVSFPLETKTTGKRPLESSAEETSQELPKPKRRMVVFHPDTKDNGIYSTGRGMSTRRKRQTTQRLQGQTTTCQLLDYAEFKAAPAEASDKDDGPSTQPGPSLADARLGRLQSQRLNVLSQPETENSGVYPGRRSMPARLTREPTPRYPLESTESEAVPELASDADDESNPPQEPIPVDARLQPPEVSCTVLSANSIIMSDKGSAVMFNVPDDVFSQIKIYLGYKTISRPKTSSPTPPRPARASRVPTTSASVRVPPISPGRPVLDHPGHASSVTINGGGSLRFGMQPGPVNETFPVPTAAATPNGTNAAHIFATTANRDPRGVGNGSYGNADPILTPTPTRDPRLSGNNSRMMPLPASIPPTKPSPVVVNTIPNTPTPVRPTLPMEQIALLSSLAMKYPGFIAGQSGTTQADKSNTSARPNASIPATTMIAEMEEPVGGPLSPSATTATKTSRETVPKPSVSMDSPVVGPRPASEDDKWNGSSHPSSLFPVTTAITKALDPSAGGIVSSPMAAAEAFLSTIPGLPAPADIAPQGGQPVVHWPETTTDNGTIRGDTTETGFSQELPDYCSSQEQTHNVKAAQGEAVIEQVTTPVTKNDGPPQDDATILDDATEAASSQELSGYYSRGHDADMSASLTPPPQSLMGYQPVAKLSAKTPPQSAATSDIFADTPAHETSSSSSGVVTRHRVYTPRFGSRASRGARTAPASRPATFRSARLAQKHGVSRSGEE